MEVQTVTEKIAELRKRFAKTVTDTISKIRKEKEPAKAKKTS